MFCIYECWFVVVVQSYKREIKSWIFQINSTESQIYYTRVYARTQGRSDEMRSVVSVVMMRSRIVLPRGICDDYGEVIWCGAAAETASALSHPFPHILYLSARVFEFVHVNHVIITAEYFFLHSFLSCDNIKI